MLIERGGQTRIGEKAGGESGGESSWRHSWENRAWGGLDPYSGEMQMDSG